MRLLTSLYGIHLRKHTSGSKHMQFPSMTDGPFYITCDCDKKFLQVRKLDRFGYKVYATTTPSKASNFYIIPTEDDEHHFEFYIAYRGGSVPAKKETVEFREYMRRQSIKEDSEQTDGQEVEELQYYLSAPVPSVHITQTGPLAMKLNVESENARFTLRNRVYKSRRFLSRNRKTVDTAPWVAHRDTFYIRCARRGLGRKAFLAVKGIGTAADTGAGTGTHPKYKTILAPSIHHHQATEECYMLFRLLPSSYKLNEFDATVDADDHHDHELEDGDTAGESEEELPNEP